MKRNREAKQRIVWIAVLGGCGLLALMSGLHDHALPISRQETQAQYALAQGCHINVATGSLYPPPEESVTNQERGYFFRWYDFLRILLWGIWTTGRAVGGILKMIVTIVLICLVGIGFV